MKHTILFEFAYQSIRFFAELPLAIALVFTSIITMKK